MKNREKRSLTYYVGSSGNPLNLKNIFSTGQPSIEWGKMLSATVPSSSESTSSTGLSSLMEEQDVDFMMSDSD